MQFYVTLIRSRFLKSDYFQAWTKRTEFVLILIGVSLLELWPCVSILIGVSDCVARSACCSVSSSFRDFVEKVHLWLDLLDVQRISGKDRQLQSYDQQFLWKLRNETANKLSTNLCCNEQEIQINYKPIGPINMRTLLYAEINQLAKLQQDVS